MLTTALQFGGGKDSLATLHLMRDLWNDILVVWLNTGAAFPETEAQMAEIAHLVPNFLEVRSDVAADIAERGWPVDVLPVRASPAGAIIGSRDDGVRLRPWTECCARNFWVPLHNAMLERGITRIIRGQRTDEQYKAPIRSGMVVDGIEYVFPLQDWSEADVFDYLARIGVEPPAYYEQVKSSLDCWLCTAFLDVKDAQVGYLKRRHPDKYAVVQARLQAINEEVREAMKPLESVL